MAASPPSSGPMKLTPWPSEYRHRWVLRRWKKLLAIRELLAVKSTSLDPVRSKMVCTYLRTVTLRCRSYSSAARAVRYARLPQCLRIASMTRAGRSCDRSRSWKVSTRASPRMVPSLSAILDDHSPR